MSNVEALGNLLSIAVGAVLAALGLILRYTRSRDKEARVSRSRLDAIEPYVFELRAKLRRYGINPPEWPERLEYLANTDDPDSGRRDD